MVCQIFLISDDLDSFEECLLGICGMCFSGNVEFFCKKRWSLPCHYQWNRFYPCGSTRGSAALVSRVVQLRHWGLSPWPVPEICLRQCDFPASSAPGCPRISSGTSCHPCKDHWLFSLGASVRNQALGLRVLAAPGMPRAECNLFSLPGSRIVLCRGPSINIASWFTALTSATSKPPQLTHSVFYTAFLVSAIMFGSLSNLVIFV